MGYGTGVTGTVTVTGTGSMWTSSNNRYIGYNGSGVLNISNGGTVRDTSVYLGYNAGSAGTVTVDGAGSQWISSGTLYIGRNGTGTLNILNGSAVSATSGGITVGTLGTVNFGSNGGTLIVNNLNASSSQFTGTGSVVTNKYLGDADWVLTTAQDLRQKTTTWNGSGQNIGVFVDLSGSSVAGDLAVGYQNSGSMAISNGLGVVSATGYVGYNSGSRGTVTIDGPGSKWTSSTLYVGQNGTGALNITNGGSVGNTNAYLGYNSGSAGTVTVDGAGSQWASSALYVGQNGTGTLNILNGSTVNVAGNTTIGQLGTVQFGNNGGAITTGSILYSPSQFSGSGTINTSGIVSDIDLVFDGAHATTQSFVRNGVTTNLNQTSSGVLGVGYLGSGTLTISGGVSVASNGGYLGYNSGSTGAATVTGPNSSWNNGTGYLYVGNNGAGSLAILNGGTVGAGSSYIGNNTGSSGSVTVSGAGSTWANTGSLLVGYNGSGNLIIANGGTVSSRDSRLGQSSGITGTVTVDGSGSKWTIGDFLYIGYTGSGKLSITNGGTVTSGYITIGCEGMYTNNGSLIVDGPGSALNSTISFRVGSNNRAGSTAFLAITNGATVNATNGYFGQYAGSSGAAIVDGMGSKWTNSAALAIGTLDNSTETTGKLSISDGGAVTANAVSITSVSTLTTDVGKGSSLIVVSGAGTLTNKGTIRVVAGASVANGTYTPISAGTWAGTGTIQALGGIWDATAHTVTVSSAAAGAAGSALTADLSTTQRFLFTDGSTGKQVGAGFQAATSPTNLTLTASSISGTELASLQSLLGTGQAVLSGWDFNATEGYTAGNPVYLSLFAGSGHSLYDLTVWHYDGSAWSKFDASDLAYDNTYASFTATGLSGYALSGTAPVPIPAAAWLLGSGLIGLVGARRRMSKQA